MDHMTDRTISWELIERARQGDQSAFAGLFRQYQARLAVFVHFHMGTLLRGRYEVEDVLQEIFLQAFRDLPDFVYRSPGSFARWLFQIARHTLQDMARYQDRHKRRASEECSCQSPSFWGREEPLDRNSPSRIFLQRERVEHLLRGLEALPEKERDLILSAKVEGLSLQQISEQTGEDKCLISLHLHRALRKLNRQVVG